MLNLIIFAVMKGIIITINRSTLVRCILHIEHVSESFFFPIYAICFGMEFSGGCYDYSTYTIRASAQLFYTRVELYGNRTAAQVAYIVNDVVAVVLLHCTDGAQMACMRRASRFPAVQISFN